MACRGEVNGIDILYLLYIYYVMNTVYGVFETGVKIAQLLWLQVCIGINVKNKSHI